MKVSHENECKNVFRNGRNEPSREHFTKVWTYMINGIERSKEVNSVRK